MTRKLTKDLPTYHVTEQDGESIVYDSNGERDYTKRVVQAIPKEQSEAFQLKQQRMDAPLHAQHGSEQLNDVNESYFVFMIYEPMQKFMTDYPTMTKGDYARLVYLSTFLQKNNTKIKRNRIHFAKPKDLPDLLKIPDRTAKRFLSRAKKSGIIFVDEVGDLNISDSVFRNGRVGRTTKSRHYARLYIQNTRALYLAFKDGKDIEHIGKLYSLIPYLDLRYNVLCENANEEINDLTEIRPLSKEQIAEILGLKNVHLLTSTLRRLKVVRQGITYSLLGEAAALATGTKVFVINPFFIYRGHPTKWLTSGAHIPFYMEYIVQARALGIVDKDSIYSTKYDELINDEDRLLLL